MPALIRWWTDDIGLLVPGATSETVAATGADLLRRWTEPHRRYHGTRHLVEMFWALEELEGAGEITPADSTIGRVAAWMHDAVYDVSAPPGANEAASAELSTRLLTRLGAPAEVVRQVDALVRMTTDHRVDGPTVPEAELTAAFHDADLWILCAPQERYDAYVAQVREEYAAVPDAAFASGRAAILADLVDRDRLYATDHAHAAWEPAARANVARELAALTSVGR